MSRKILPPYRQDDPSPGEHRRRGHAVIVIVVLLLGGALLIDGRDLRDVLLCVLSLGAAGSAVARWTTGEAPAPPLPAVAGLLGRVR